MDKDANKEIIADLEAAASETEPEESSTEEEVEETEAKASEKEEEKSKPGRKGASNRIQELVEKRKDLESELEKMQETISSRDEEIQKLVDLLELRDNDSKVVAELNRMHQESPELRPYIEAIDKAMRGEEYDIPGVEKEAKRGAKADESKTDEALKLIQEAKGEMSEALADQYTELVLHKVDLLTDRYMEQLPETYNDDDRRVILDSLVEHLNWDAIEENPDGLPDTFAEGFQKCLNWYGTPRGAQATVPEGEEGTTRNKGAEPFTQEKLDEFARQNWGKLKTVETPDGKRVEPEVSEDDFKRALGQAMRKQNDLSNQ